MRRFQRPLTATALALVLTTQAARADLAAADVWGDLRDYLTGFGYTVSGTEAASNGTLTVTDFGVGLDLSENQGKFDMKIGTVTFAEQADGSVLIGFPPDMKVNLDSALGPGETVNMTFNFFHQNLAVTASGTPEQMHYDYNADQIVMRLAEVIVEGKPLPPEDMAATITLEGYSGSSDVAVAALRNISQSGQIASVTYDAVFTDTNTGEKGSVSGTAQGLSFDGSMSVPLDAAVQASDMSAMIRAGFGVDSTISYSGGTMTIHAEGPDGPVDGNTASQGGKIGVKMSAEGLSYDIAQTGLSVNMVAASAPLPIAFEVATAAFKLVMPVQKSDTPADFALGLTLGDFTVSEMLWGIFDPQAQLPRDPATILLDITGKARVVLDFLDPKAMADDPQIAPPAQIDAIDINALQIKLAGAELTGTGAFTIDNSLPSGGMPKAAGAVDLKLVGGNGLLDKLVAMGLLPQDQAMGARMMMGMLGVPGSDPDTLTSKIEIKDDGQILANGQRIQ